jgi:RES domain-containing protein
VDLVALDLTDANVTAILGISPEALTAEDKTLPRKLAREAKQAGFQALLVPSAAVRGQRNAVLFLENLPERPEIIAAQPVTVP